MSDKLRWERTGMESWKSIGGEVPFFIEVRDRRHRVTYVVPGSVCRTNDVPNQFHTFDEAAKWCDLWQAPFYSEPSTIVAQTPDGPVFTYSGAMPTVGGDGSGDGSGSSAPDEAPMPGMDEPIPFAPAVKAWPSRRPTPYVYRERLGEWEISLSFATCEEMVAYAREGKS